MNKDDKQIRDLIDRYLYQVTKRLPKAQCADIEQELRGLIDDMLAAKADVPPTKEDMIAVLRELGHPAELAAKYSGTKNWLIGPEYFDTYLMVLKIVLAVSAFGIMLAQVLEFAFEPKLNILAAIAEFFATVFSALVQAFAWVTGIFAIIERVNEESPGKDKSWNPADLPPVPEHKANTIKRSDPIVGIVFTVLFLVLINAVPNLMVVHMFTNTQGHVSVQVFDPAVFFRLLPLINAMIAIGLVKEMLRLIVGRYTIGLSLTLVLLNVISMMMFIWLFGPSSGIWNPNFVSEIGAGAFPQAMLVWRNIPMILVGLCIFGNIVGSLKLIVQAFRHKEQATA